MTISEKEKDNILRWDGEKRNHFEVYYLKWNDLKNQAAFWVRYTMTSPPEKVGAPYCELWGIFFDSADPKNNFAVKNRFPIDKFSWDKDRFRVGIADAEITMNACHASITNPEKGFSLSWNLLFDSSDPTFYYFSKDLMNSPILSARALSPHQNARFAGKVVANGREIKFTDAPGQQTHIWAVKNAQNWVWGHCNAFKEDPEACWEAMDSQTKFGPIPSPHYKIFFLRTKDKTYYFTTMPKCFTHRSKWKLGYWTFEAENDEAKLVGEASTSYEDMVGVTYTDPDGELLWCNNSKVGTIRLKLFDKKGALITELSCDRACAIEFANRKTYPEVPVRI